MFDLVKLGRAAPGIRAVVSNYAGNSLGVAAVLTARLVRDFCHKN